MHDIQFHWEHTGLEWSHYQINWISLHAWLIYRNTISLLGTCLFREGVNNLVNKANVISAKSEHAKNFMLEIIDVRYNWTNS